MKPRELAPVVLFVYNRPEHTRKTLEALARSPLAKETDLFVFADGCKTEKHRDGVNAVHELIDGLQEKEWFRSTTINKSNENRGLADSIIMGSTSVLNKYEKIIVLEDDLETAEDFLNYMNEALVFYQSYKEIWSISGYSFPLKATEQYPYDVFLTGRGCSWGWATWKDRWDTVDWSVSDYAVFKRDRRARKNFGSWGPDMPFMLDAQQEGRNHSWAIRWCYAQYKQSRYTIYPCRSRIKNIGTDGSGTNYRTASNRYDTVLYTGEQSCRFVMPPVNEKIRKEFRRKYLSVLGEVRMIIRQLLKNR